MHNKYIKIFFVINFLIVLILFCSFILIKSKYNPKIIKNIVIVEKKWEIIKNSENPNNILQKENSSEILISNWIFITKNIIITTAHSVWNENNIYEITNYFWEKMEANLIKTNEQNDLAFLKTEKDFSEFQNININKTIKKWQKIQSYLFNLKTKNIEIISWKILEINWENIISNLQFEKWNSGSPLFNKDFELIWINKEFNKKNQTWISSLISQ